MDAVVCPDKVFVKLDMGVDVSSVNELQQFRFDHVLYQP